MWLNLCIRYSKVGHILLILLMLLSLVLSKVSKYGYDEDEETAKKKKMMQGRTMSQDLQKGQRKYGWEGNCIECSLMDVDTYNLTVEDLPEGCMDKRVQHTQTSNNSEYCTWRVIHTEGKYGKVGLVGVKADELNHMDPKPETCVKHKFHYTCSCLGEVCNKGFPPCKWIKKADPENKNPLGCLETEKLSSVWVGNCVECSLMDVDYYNLTIEQLQGGCMDKRVQHFEKTNNSPYCTWRVIHTEGKAGKIGLLTLLGDHLNHMDPPPGQCVKHSFHYTCACVGEYCNQNLPPCEWIKKCDPKNSNPIGCAKDGKEINVVMAEAFKGKKSCLKCDAIENRKKLTDVNRACKEKSIRYLEDIFHAPYCMWNIVHKTETFVKTIKVWRGALIQLGTELLPKDNPKPDSCVSHEGKYYCSCRGHYCNENLPMCSWMRKANPEDKVRGFQSCFEDSPQRSGSTKCVKCFHHYNMYTKYKNLEGACEDPRVQDFMTIEDANYCMTVIDYERMKGMSLVKDHDLDNFKLEPGSCKLSHQKYWCACKGDWCNREPPPCSWMRKANPQDSNPKGCIEDGKDAQGSCVYCVAYHSKHEFNITTADLQNGCQDPRINVKRYVRNAKYCMWMIRRTDDVVKGYEWRRKGWVTWKGAKLLSKDPEPGTCITEGHSYICACEGNLCNKALPPCSWIRKINPEDNNPKMCAEDDEDKELVPGIGVGKVKTKAVKKGEGRYNWEGNCVECSIMDVDFYNLTAEQLKDGCQDPRVQHFEKSNNSEYCTWRLIHTEGKHGNVGIISVKADQLNHMDPPPESCVKHKFHYTCSCVGEYCNKGLPPCAWIRKCDPENTNPIGCRSPDTNGFGWIGNCVECNLMDVDFYKLTVDQLKAGCMDPRVQHYSKTNKAEYCTWRVVHTLGKSGTQPGIVALKGDHLNHMDPSTGSCVKHDNHYTCACTGEYCNKGLPPCAWIRKIDPDVTTFTGCTETYMGCVSCDLLQSEKRYKIAMDKTKDGCMDPRIQDLNAIQVAEFCMWTITSKPQPNYKLPEGQPIRAGTMLLPQSNPPPGKCTASDGNFYCSCSGHLCNMVTPRCSMLRKAMSSKTNPKGCFEDQRKYKGKNRCSKCFYHPHAWSNIRDDKRGCENPKLQDFTSIDDADYCVWVIEYMHFKGLIIIKDRNLDPDLKIEPNTCQFLNNKYYCACKGNMCNKMEPQCSWFRKANPKEREPKGCFEDESKAEVKEDVIPKGLYGEREKVQTVAPGQGNFDWEGNCIECSLMDVDHYNLKAEDLKGGCQDPRVQHYEKTNNSEYCTWRIIHTDGKFGKAGIVSVKADRLNHMDPKPESCVKHKFHYTCACIGEYCNKDLPPCSWIRKCDPENKNPLGCLGLGSSTTSECESAFNCVECSLMDVDNFNLTPEELDGGCQDSRVQSFPKNNQSEYCTWRIVHTLGKTGTPPGAVSVKADKLNHMDPSPGTCVRHKQHYTCACTGEYCNKELPPCSWIRKIDPENTEPVGCLEDDPSSRIAKKIKCKEGNPGIDCAYCSLDDLRKNDSKTEDNACNEISNMDFETQHGTKYEFTHCGWVIQGQDIPGYKRGALFSKRGAFPQELEEDCPGTCTYNDLKKQRYYCHCGQDRCNTKLPPCSWLRAANPEDKNPAGCVEDAVKTINSKDALALIQSGNNCIKKSTSSSKTETTPKPSLPEPAPPPPKEANKNVLPTTGEPSKEIECSTCLLAVVQQQHKDAPIDACNIPKYQQFGKSSEYGGMKDQKFTYCAWLIGPGPKKEPRVMASKQGFYSIQEKDYPPGTCQYLAKNDMYNCFCAGNMCNKDLPPCAWLRAANPNDKNPPQCKDDTKSSLKCVHCTYDPYEPDPYPDLKNGCEDKRLHDYSKNTEAYCCVWQIGYEDNEKGKILGLRGETSDGWVIGSCILTPIGYHCACKGHMCNKEKPPCSWLRKANPDDKNPQGCLEDGLARTAMTYTMKYTVVHTRSKIQTGFEGEDKSLIKGNVRTTSAGVKKGEGRFDWEGNCVECSLMDVDFYNLTVEDVPNGCMDERIQYFEETDNSEYCTWRIIHTDGKHGNAGIVSVKADQLNHMDPVPETCVKHKFHYTCACIGEYCNKDLPPCTWITRADPANTNPVGCLKGDIIKSGEDWIGNCIECSTMDVDFYGLTADELKGGCMDPRVQHYEKTNNSAYCTWRIVHTKGKSGDVGTVVVKADRLNHMDPKPSTCLKHRNHYTCACIGEYCNKELPPCAWITAVDPENKDFPGCLENGGKMKTDVAIVETDYDDKDLIGQILRLITRIKEVLSAYNKSKKCLLTDNAKIAAIVKALSK